MSYIFSGKKYVNEKEADLRRKVVDIKKDGTIPQLVIFQIGENKASEVFLKEKAKFAKKVGIKLRLIFLEEDTDIHHIAELIKKENNNQKVHGVMIQLPLPKNFSKDERDQLITTIDSQKDVDGMREDSLYTTPVVRAVVSIVREACMKGVRDRPLLQGSVPCMKVVVVGAKGFVGRRIVEALGVRNYSLLDERNEKQRIITGKISVVGVTSKNIEEIKRETLKADILISVTGVSGLIKGDMVKKGAIVIDVGSPKGDVVTSEVVQRASFLSPVPGGVGPLTVYFLMENLVEALIGIK